MEAQNQNLQPEPAGKLPVSPAAEAIQSENQDYMFFNVMPQEKNRGSLVEPSIVAPHAATSNGQLLELFKQYRIYIFILLAILIGGPLIYFIASNMAGQSYQSENLLNPNANSTGIIVHKPAPVATSTPGTGTSTPGSTAFTTPQAWRDKYFPNCSDNNVCGD